MPLVIDSPDDAGSAMATLADLIEATKRLLYTGGREELNKLHEQINESNTEDTLRLRFSEAGTSSGGVQPGAKLSIDLEDMHVWTVEDPVTTYPLVTVERAQFGSAPAFHFPGALITVGAKFSNFDIFRAINEVIGELNDRGLFWAKAIALTAVSGQIGYDLVGVDDMIGVDPLAITWEDTSTTLDVHPQARAFHVDLDADTSAFPSGRALFVWDYVPAGQPIRFVYRAPLQPLSAITDNVVDTTGLRASAVALLAWGAARNLTETREISRNFHESQGNSRRAGEVPMGAQRMAAGGPAARFEARLNQAISDLKRDYPDYRPRYGSRTRWSS